MPSNGQKVKGIKNMKRFISIVLLLSLVLSVTSCHRAYVPKDTKIPNADKVKIDVSPVFDPADTPETAVTDMGVDLLKGVYKGDENILVSPVSVSLALGLTAGGAKENTLAQFERLLGRGVSMSDMNRFYEWIEDKFDDTESIEIESANSIWIKDDKNAVDVNKAFLEFADESFDAEVYNEPFNDATAKKINAWVDDNTDGMIKNIVDKIDPLTVMYLINAIAFDAEWQRRYTDTSDWFRFTNVVGQEETVTGMFSSEKKYIEDENTTGFVKDYKGGEYGFAVFLPDENVSINDYVSSLSGEKLRNMLNGIQNVNVEAKLPKFTYEYSVKLNDTLKTMGLVDAFEASAADLSGIGTSSYGNLHIGEVLHKTFIEVAEKGTKAAAVTSVAVNTESAPAYPENTKFVIVNRPFVYAIIDNETNLPLFIGVVLTVG